MSCPWPVPDVDGGIGVFPEGQSRAEGGVVGYMERCWNIGRRRACADSFFFFTDSDYIQIRSPVYLSHSSGRYATKRFRKAQCPIIERLTNSLMMNGRNNGKKLMAVRIVAHTFEIVRFSQLREHGVYATTTSFTGNRI